MKPLTVIATLVAKAGCEDQLREELEALLAPTRAEAGCIDYELHRSHEQPGTFVFTESWATKEAWERHRESAHVKAFGAKRGELVERGERFVGETV